MSNMEKWERRYAEVLDQNNSLKVRVAALEAGANAAHRTLTNLLPIIGNGLLSKQQLAFIDPHIEVALTALDKILTRTPD